MRSTFAPTLQTAFLILIGVTMTLGQDPEHPVAPVAASDLIRRIPITGTLAVPLWKLIKVRGRWAMPPPLSKSSALVFHVTQIDGRGVEPAIEFPAYRVQPVLKRGYLNRKNETSWHWNANWSGSDAVPNPAPSEEWELVGVESGRIVGFPREVWDSIGGAPAGIEGFVTDFNYTSASRR